MDIGAIIIIIIISAILVLTFYIIGVYNKLVNAKNIVEDKFVQIDTELEKKADLILNLTEIVKEYAKHEEKLLNELINASNKQSKATSINGKIKASNNLNKELTKLNILLETYPELKSNKKFITVKKSLETIEDKIEYAKSFYNDTVSNYNNQKKEFPSNIVVKVFKFDEIDYFK